MKFTINTVAKSGARLGSLTEFVRSPSTVLETPYLLLHTRGGSVPHLSYDLLQMVSNETHLMQMPLVTLLDAIESVRVFGKGVAEFAGLKEYLSYVTVQDSGTATPEGYHDKRSISMWTKGGRKLIDATQFISSVEALNPDIFQLLCDGDTNINSSNKRTKKSVDASLNFAKLCCDLKDKSMALKDTPMFISVTGGYNTRERIRYITEIKELNVSGYVIDGFHTNGESASSLHWEDVEPVLIDTLAALPDSVPRVFHGAVTPTVLLKLVAKGIDVFDATFPWMVAERGSALVFPNSISFNECEVVETLPLIKKVQIEQKDEDVKLKNDIKTAIDHSYEISLKDKKYFNDPKPLVSNCSCYSCRKYSRAYLNHLMATGELLGFILLMMHNLHHYLCFFKNIRSAVKEDRFEELQTRLQTFLDSNRS